MHMLALLFGHVITLLFALLFGHVITLLVRHMITLLFTLLFTPWDALFTLLFILLTIVHGCSRQADSMINSQDHTVKLQSLATPGSHPVHIRHTLATILPAFLSSRKAPMTSTALFPFIPMASFTCTSSTNMNTLCCFSSSMVNTPVATPPFLPC